MILNRFRRVRQPSFWLAGCLLAAFAASGGTTAVARSHPAAPPASLDDQAHYDPRAAAVLKRMGEAYARLGAFDLRIAISSTLIPLEVVPDSTALAMMNVDPTPFHVDESALRPQGHLHLAFQQSNHLLLETEQTDPATNKPFDVRWVCDGQSFWSYTGDKKVYTREKAPGSIHDFARLKNLNSGTLELMMLIGPNPFADLMQSVDGAHRLADADVRGIPTEVVSLLIEDPIEQSELRLYIGKGDGLLHRMEIESVPIKPHEGPIKVGSKLDALIDAGVQKPPPEETPSLPGVPDTPAASPPPPLAKPVGSFLRFENDLELTPNFPAGTFTFTPPKDGLMYGDQAPVKRLTMKQRIAQMAKSIRQKRAQMLRNGRSND
jgi:hypothetical protein